MRTKKVLSPDDPRRIARDKAVEAAGGPKALGRLLGITSQSVGGWPLIPAERVLDIEAITGLSRHYLRPDVFGDDNQESVMTRTARIAIRSQSLADALGIPFNEMSRWEDKVPAERVLEVERHTGISRHRLRPDVFGPPEEKNASPSIKRTSPERSAA